MAIPPPASSTPTAFGNQFAIPEKASQSSPSPLEQHRNHAYDEVKRDTHKPSSASRSTVQEAPRSTATATVDGPEQSEHCEDGSRTSVPGHNPPKDGGLDIAQSLWDRAYAALGTASASLVMSFDSSSISCNL